MSKTGIPATRRLAAVVNQALRGAGGLRHHQNLDRLDVPVGDLLQREVQPLGRDVQLPEPSARTRVPDPQQLQQAGLRRDPVDHAERRRSDATGPYHAS